MEFERFTKFLEEERPVSDFAAKVRGNDISKMSRYLKVGVERTKLLHILLGSTPIVQANDFSFSRYSQGDLGEFIRLLKSHKPAVETLLELEVRNDVSTKAVRMLGNVLQIIGLGHQSDGRVKSRGKHTYYYKLDAELLEQMKSFIERRQNQFAWPFLAETYGWKRNLDDD